MEIAVRLGVSIEAAVPHLQGLKSGTRPLGARKQVKEFLAYLNATLTQEERDSLPNLRGALTLGHTEEQAEAEAIAAMAIPQGVCTVLSQDLAMAAGLLQAMPASELTEAMGLASKGSGQSALATAASLWGATLLSSSVAATQTRIGRAGRAPRRAGGAGSAATGR